ncbi:MAG: 4-(cytidine 5'-diphospho)-2-C-methyl-D-erythritol kinase [Clostridia bacterium]|nr:4-(cytidine 5'-diphospho)-2-C-methyl-D-erythritol kinase [Clostridia bacterium]
MDEIKLKAMAKINLGLDVIRRREDGYHEVRMIMQNVNLYDTVSMKKCAENKIKVRTNLYYLPTNENNLVYKAAKLLKDEFDLKEGVEIDLKKHIPVAAGMAGGSADAATVLYGMNRLFKLGLSKENLMKRGVKIGADVPYCIMRGTALSEGIGEILTPLPSMPKCHVLIAKPGISLSTKYVYENLHANELKQHPDIDGIIEGIREKNVKKVAAKLENVLETVSIKEHPIIAEIKEFMKQNGALNAIMSGSGPTVFGIYDDLSLAEQAYQKLKAKNLAKQVFLTETFNLTEEA